MTMKMEHDTMEATNLVLLLVRAMVASPDGVSVSSSLSSSGSTIIQIKVPVEMTRVKSSGDRVALRSH
jgi:predicted RNA-binding protein YlqC (UPF0109 family)